MLAGYRFELSFRVFSGLSCLPQSKIFAILERRNGGGLVKSLVSGGHTVFGQGTTHLFDMVYYDIVTML